MEQFVHLHVHSEYSLLDGAARIEALVARAAAYQMPALALTDHGVMYGIIPFYKTCLAQGIKPIIGLEVCVNISEMDKQPLHQYQAHDHLILLAKNRQGYRNLLHICSAGHSSIKNHKPQIDFHTLQKYTTGIIALSGCIQGELVQHLLHERVQQAQAIIKGYQAIFQDGFYFELQDHGLLEQKKVNNHFIALSQETGIPLVATNNIHYMQAEDAELHDILVCIGTGAHIADKNHLHRNTNQRYFKTAAEMKGLFSHVSVAIDNTVRIAEQCQVTLDFDRYVLPAYYPLPDGMKAAQYLQQLCSTGLQARYASLSIWTDSTFRHTAEARLTYELHTIEKMGFSDYFLIVWDFIRFAHRQGIMTGPGRGSAAGSLVAYCLSITQVDPLKYQLLFERFLNPQRVTMPDIDVDFNDERRDEVLKYVADKYGYDRVAQIITFGTMAARAVVRDVGRVLQISTHEIDWLAKQIPAQSGMTLERALQASSQLREWIKRTPRMPELIALALKLEGLPRHVSTHAAGLVISDKPLLHDVPLQATTGRIVLTQYAMEQLTTIGMLKIDFLGLRTLSIIERTLHWINLQRNTPFDLQTIHDTDEATYAMLCRGETMGVFQLESVGVRRVLRKLRPTVFEDIISVLALYRPGPMEFISKYIESKHGKKEVEYPHPKLQPILQATYGIIVYQEQIIQIASQMAGFSFGEADLLRRAISKKNRTVLAQQRHHFVAGSLQQGYTEKLAHSVYDLIVRFADYGFPRAHAVAYGMLAWQTAFLKVHYPAEFMAAILTANMGNFCKIATYIESCRQMGIHILPPDINESIVEFTPLTNAIRFGLGAIKHVGTLAVENIVQQRNEKPFIDLLDFCQRIDLRICNRKVVEALIRVGAFERLPGHRAQMLAMLDEVYAMVTKWRKERENLQIKWFGFTEVNNWKLVYPDVPTFSKIEQFTLEREGLGFCLSGHPLDEHTEWLAPLELDRLVDLQEVSTDHVCIVAGMVEAVRAIRTKKGQAMAFIQLQDQMMQAEVVLFPEVWQRATSFTQVGMLIVVQAKVQQQATGYKLIAYDVIPLEPGEIMTLAKRLARQTQPKKLKQSVKQGEKRSPAHDIQVKTERDHSISNEKSMETKQYVCIKIAPHCQQQKLLQQLKKLLQCQSGEIPVVLFYERDQQLRVLSATYALQPSPQLFERIEALLGTGAVCIKSGNI